METTAIPEMQVEIQERLREWVNQQPGSITVEEAAEFLGMPQDADGTYYAIPTIGKALERLGCEKEVLVHYWPPIARQQLQPLQTDREKLQNIINIIRDWVLSQTDQFAISDIYARPELSQDLPCNPATLQLIHQALIKLRCTVNMAVTDFNVYKPPPGNTRQQITEVIIDDIYT